MSKCHNESNFVLMSWYFVGLVIVFVLMLVSSLQNFVNSITIYLPTIVPTCYSIFFIIYRMERLLHI